MKYIFKPAPNYKGEYSTPKIMTMLLVGLLLVLGFSFYNAYTMGMDVLIHVVILTVASAITSVAIEVIYALIIKQKPVDFLKSSFPLITSLILVLISPVNASVYSIIICTTGAIILGKLIFGGFGQNIFNPAGVGRAIFLVSFASASVDVVSGATPIQSLAKLGWAPSASQFSGLVEEFGGIGNLFFGNYYGAIGETSVLVMLLVGVYLAFKRVIDYRIPVIYLSTIFICGLIIGFTNGLSVDYALFHVLTGGAVFGAIFMLTDPVTNPMTRSGKVMFALGAAFITVVIRIQGQYDEGVLFSILIMNMLTPVIDRMLLGQQYARLHKNILAIVVIAAIGFATVFGISTNLKNTDTAVVETNNNIVLVGGK